MSDSKRVSARSLSGDAAALAFGALVAQGAILLTISAVARLVPKSAVGTYQQLSLIYSITAPLFLGGIPPALLYFLPRSANRHELHEWILRSYAFLATCGVALGLFTVLLRDPLGSLMNNPALPSALLLYAPYICFAFIIAAAPAVLVATGRAQAAGVVSALGGIVTFVCVVTAALILPDAQALAAGLSVSGGLVAIGTLVFIVRSLALVPRWPSSTATSWPSLLSFGLPVALGGVTARLGYQLDQVVVSAKFPPADFAVYALGAIELPISLLIQQAVSNVLAPAMTIRWRTGDILGMVAMFREAVRKTTLIAAPMFTFFMLESGDMIQVLYGSRYSGSANIFRIYLLLMPIRVATWGLIPQAVGRTRINLTAAWIILPVNAILAFSLVGPLGLEGPALAAPGGALASTLYYLIRIRGIVSMPIRDLLPLKHGLYCFVVSTCTVAIVAPMQWLDMSSLIRLVATFCIFTLCTVVAFRRLRLVRDDDWGRLRRLVSKQRLVDLWPSGASAGGDGRP